MAHPKLARPTRALMLVSIAALLVAGCGTRVVKTEVSEGDEVTVFLRHRLRNGRVVDRGYEHPTAIAPQRLEHILGAIDIEERVDGRRERRVAIHPELLQPISRALVGGFEKADSTQEVALMAVRKERRLGLFHRKYLTSLVAWFEDERLYIHLSRVEWEIPKRDEGGRLPEPDPGEKQMAFRTVAGAKMVPAGSQAVAVRWRDPLFTAPVRTVREGDDASDRRTILMESPLPADGGGEGIDPTRYDAATLRALADLMEARKSGSITEAEYRERLEELIGDPGY